MSARVWTIGAIAWLLWGAGCDDTESNFSAAQPGMGAQPAQPSTAGVGAPGPDMPVEQITTEATAGSGAGSDVVAQDPGSPAMTPETGSSETCALPPDGADPAAAIALDAVNAARLPAGSGCATMIAEINLAAQNHCDYYAQNSGSCTANAHGEVEGCAGFTGESAGARMQAAGYTGRGSSEVMAFSDDPQRAVDMWINSVWHRLPVLDPWTTELGYGHAPNCDTIDFGQGQTPDDSVIAVYPYDGQLDVPTSFDGSREGPEPPAPDSGWPSASPITLFGVDLAITEHTITREGDDTPIEHVWLTSEDSNMLRRAVMLYPNLPFEPETSYRVHLVGSHAGGPVNLEWTFTTGAAQQRFR